jgi:hypothetical protein
MHLEMVIMQSSVFGFHKTGTLSSKPCKHCREFSTQRGLTKKDHHHWTRDKPRDLSFLQGRNSAADDSLALYTKLEKCTSKLIRVECTHETPTINHKSHIYFTFTLISLPKTVLQLPCDWVLYYLGCLQRITLQNIALLCKILIPSWSNLSMMKHACQQWWRSSILTLSATSQITLISKLIINCFISLFSKLQAAQQPFQTAFHFFKSSN